MAWYEIAIFGAMKKCRDSFLVKIFWFCFSLHLLNISADTSALLKQNQTIYLDYNYQESIAEILIETVLGNEDFFQELNEGTDSDSELNKPFKPFFLSPTQVQFALLTSSLFDTRNLLDYFCFRFQSIITGVDSPPPEIYLS